jgi:hypothetical protein
MTDLQWTFWIIWAMWAASMGYFLYSDWKDRHR